MNPHHSPNHCSTQASTHCDPTDVLLGCKLALYQTVTWSHRIIMILFLKINNKYSHRLVMTMTKTYQDASGMSTYFTYLHLYTLSDGCQACGGDILRFKSNLFNLLTLEHLVNTNSRLVSIPHIQRGFCIN